MNPQHDPSKLGLVQIQCNTPSPKPQPHATTTTSSESFSTSPSRPPSSTIDTNVARWNERNRAERGLDRVCVNPECHMSLLTHPTSATWATCSPPPNSPTSSPCPSGTPGPRLEGGSRLEPIGETARRPARDAGWEASESEWVAGGGC